MLIFYLFIVSGAVYLTFIIFFIVGWQRLNDFEQKCEDVKISVVVAVRNEQQNIENLIKSLIRQHYPTNNYEVIIVDDHSADNTVNIIKKYDVKLIRNKNSGKKYAVYEGVKSASGEIIAITDADCTVSPWWLATIAAFYKHTKASLIIAPVLFTADEGFFAEFQFVEFASLAASAAGSAFFNPVLINAANMIFKRDFYLEVVDTLKFSVKSGDDMFLLVAAKANNQKIAYLKSRNALVFTAQETSIKNFFNQRKRWASKTPKINDLSIIVLAISVFLFNFLMLFLPFIVSIPYLQAIGLFLFLKIIVDYLLINNFLSFYGFSLNIFHFIIFSFLYPFYVVTTVVGAIFGYKWK